MRAAKPPADQMGKKKCCCGLDWCQALDNRELDRGGEGYPSGCMRLPRDRPEDLARWLKPGVLLKRPADGQDTFWTADRVSRCVADPRQEPFAAMRLGKWHFPPEAFGSTGRLDWEAAVRPWPSVPRDEALERLQ